MTLTEAIEKFRERVESSPAFLEMKEKLAAQAAEMQTEEKKAQQEQFKTLIERLKAKE